MTQYELGFSGPEIDEIMQAGYTLTPAGIYRRERDSAVIWREGVNQLVKTEPTVIAYPSSSSGVSAVSSSGPWVSPEVGPRKYCPISGRKAFIGQTAATADGYVVSFENLSGVTFADTDVLMVAVWSPTLRIDPDGAGAAKVTLRLFTDATPGANYREVSFRTRDLSPGWVLLKILWVEDNLTSGETGRIGTSPYSAEGDYVWGTSGTAVKGSTFQSIQVIMDNMPDAYEFRVGSVAKAPEGWAVTPVCLGFDDGYLATKNITFPAIEARGWRGYLPFEVGSSYDNKQGNKLSLQEIRDMASNGHTLIGHSFFGENIAALTNDEVLDEHEQFTNFCLSRGFGNAARFYTHVQGSFTEYSISVLEGLGYKMARGVFGRQSVLTPGACHPLAHPGMSFEVASIGGPWDHLSRYNGAIKKGEIINGYGHETIVSSNEDTSPGTNLHTTAHLENVLDLLQAAEDAGNCVVVSNPADACRLAGHDPYGKWAHE